MTKAEERALEAYPDLPKQLGSVRYLRREGFKEGYEAAQKDLLEWARKELETLSLYYEKMGHVTGSIGRNDTFGKIEECKKLIQYIESL